MPAWLHKFVLEKVSRGLTERKVASHTPAKIPKRLEREISRGPGRDSLWLSGSSSNGERSSVSIDMICQRKVPR